MTKKEFDLSDFSPAEVKCLTEDLHLCILYSSWIRQISPEGYYSHVLHSCIHHYSGKSRFPTDLIDWTR